MYSGRPIWRVGTNCLLHRFQRQAKKSNLPVHWANFRKSRNKTINIIRRQKELYFDNLIAKLKSRQTSVRDWWKSASQLVGRNSNNSVIPPLNCSNNIVYDDAEKAEVFNTFLSSRSNIDDTDKSVPADDTPPPRCLDRIVLRQHEVQDVLRLLNTNKASGPDAIHAKQLKVAYDIISKPLCAIFNISLITKHFPNKLANVTPVHKKEDKNIIGNYRPISLLPISSKVFEKCIYKHIFNFIRDLITEHQSGFAINDSTRNQLLYIANMFSKALDEGKEIRIIFFDILAKPLIEYGIGVFFLN